MDEPESSTAPARTLTVTGRGTASADADLAVLRFGVTGRDPSYAASVGELDRRVEALRADLEATGVERDRLRTTGFDVRPDTRYDRERNEDIFLAYVASHRLRLELPFDKDVLNGVLTRVARSASEAAVTVSFDVSDRQALRSAAMEAAVIDARASARVLAEAAGATLGEMVRIDYSHIEVRTRGLAYELAEPAQAFARSMPAPDVHPQALDAEEGVTVVWEVTRPPRSLPG